MPDALATALTNTDPNSDVTAYTQRLGKPWKMSEDGVKFLEGWEAYCATIYDSDGSKVGNATVGYGHLVHLGKISGAASEKPFQKGNSEAQAEALLRQDIGWAERTINDAIKVPLFQFEYDALVCFMYNLQHHGDGLLDFVNTGQYNRVGDKMRTYATSQGHPVKGLLRRRFAKQRCSKRGFMILRTKFLFVLALLPIISSAKTVYSGEFDYRDFKSPEASFSGRTQAGVAHMCNTGEHASNDDLAQCSHLKFNNASSQLEKRLKTIRSKSEKNDKSLKADGEPLSSPYFEKAQVAWTTYRDNECYSETYSMGEAAERYIFFWECMANITKSRVKELDELLKY